MSYSRVNETELSFRLPNFIYLLLYRCDCLVLTNTRCVEHLKRPVMDKGEYRMEKTGEI